MTRLIVDGKAGPVYGSTGVHGEKNVVLPLLCASLYDDTPFHIENIPDIIDARNMITLLRELGAEVEVPNGDIYVQGGTTSSSISKKYVKMRGGYYPIPALLAKHGKADFYVPKGCEIGARKMDFTLKGWKKMGVKIEGTDHIYLTTDGLKGANHTLPYPSYGATINLIHAGLLAEGTTTIRGAATEEGIRSIIEAHIERGAIIEYDFENPNDKKARTIVVHGGYKPREVSVVTPNDPHEIGTLLMAGAITKGEVTITDLVERDFRAIKPVIDTLVDIGYCFDGNESSITISVDGSDLPSAKEGEIISKGFSAPDKVITVAPHPKFPTDKQEEMTAVATQLYGFTVIDEQVFEDRYKHVEPLLRMGAHIEVKEGTRGPMMVVYGPTRLRGQEVTSPDLRGGISLLLAGLVAEGQTVINNWETSQRGVQNIEQTLVNKLHSRSITVWD